MEPKEPYDLELVYDALIAPLMSRVIAICQEYNMPMVASFAYRHEAADDASFCSTLINPTERFCDKYEMVRIILLQGTHQ